MDGSFCLWRNGSPPGHFVPETMLTFCPGVGPCAYAMRGMITASRSAKLRRTDKLFVNGASAPRIARAATEFGGLTRTSFSFMKAYASVGHSFGGDPKSGDARRTTHNMS